MISELNAVLYSDGSVDAQAIEDDLKILKIPYGKLYMPNDSYDAYTQMGPELQMNRYPFSARTRDGIWACFIHPILDERGITIEQFYEMEEKHGKS